MGACPAGCRFAFGILPAIDRWRLVKVVNTHFGTTLLLGQFERDAQRTYTCVRVFECWTAKTRVFLLALKKVTPTCFIYVAHVILLRDSTTIYCGIRVSDFIVVVGFLAIVACKRFKGPRHALPGSFLF